MSEPEKPQITPSDAATQFKHHREVEVSNATVESQKTPIRLFTEWLEDNDKQLSQLTGMDLQTFYNHLKTDRGIEKTTRGNYMTAIRVFLRWLENLDAAPSGIADKIHQPTFDKSEKVRDEEIDPERVQKIVDWRRKFKYASRDHVIIELLWHTGIRLGSLRSIDLQDVTELDGQPVIELKHRPDQDTPLKNKMDGERPVNLKPKVADAVQDYIDHQRILRQDEYGRDHC